MRVVKGIEEEVNRTEKLLKNLEFEINMLPSSKREDYKNEL